MQSKATRNKFPFLLKLMLPVFLLCVLNTLQAQTYINGNLSTGPTTLSGIAAPTGTTWSEVQNDAGNLTESNTNSGYAASDTSGLTVADDFTVPAGQSWRLSKLIFYAYRTGAPATPSPFVGLTVQIHKGNPALGPTTIVFGDLTTNRMTATNDAQMWRIFNTVAPPPGTAQGTTRKIWTVEADVDVTLGEGTYWLEWKTRTTGNLPHFAPGSTVVGARTVAGYNGMQHTLATNTWAPLIDAGAPATAPDVPLDMPFQINYAQAAACSGAPTPGNTVASTTSACSGVQFTLGLQNNIPGTGITYQWQSSSDGVNFTNIAGATAGSLTTSLTASTYYQAVVTCGGTPVNSTPIQVNLQAPTITAQPTDVTANCSASANFTVTATGSPITYQWQQRVSAAAPWTDVVAGVDATTGAIFSNVTTNDLSILNISSAMNGYQYRVSLNSGCATPSFSNPATLTVTPLTITVNPATVNACASATTPLSVAITNQATVVSAPVTTPFASGTVNLAIPENQAGVLSTIPVSVPAGAIISAASVTLNVTHPWTGDLIIALKAPNNNVLNLAYALNATGGTAATTGFTNTVISSTGTTTLDVGTDPWTGTFAPDAPATPVAGIPSAPTLLSPTNANVFNFAGLYSTASGDWTLGLYDLGAPDVGTLVNWTLTLTYTYPVTQPFTGVWTPATGLFTDAAGTVAYTAGSQADSVWVVPTASTSYSVAVNSAACPSAPATVNLTINQPVTTVSDPADAAICPGANTSFTATAAAGSPLTYQWQVSTDGGTTFTDVTNGGIYSGATTSTLTLTAATAAENNNQYQVIAAVAGCNSVTSTPATLTINSAATIATQPTNVTACAGGDATFTVVGAGGSLTYQWAVSTDGGTTFTPIAGATSDTYVATAVTAAMNNNQYQVVVGNACTTPGVLSSNATLTVSDVATITTQPVNTAACEGTDVTITTVASAATYQWQESTDGGTTWTDIAGQTTPNLTLTAITASMNNNQYRLVAFSCGPTGLNSDPATLTVNTGASFTTQPTNTTACIGNDATFTAVTAGSGTVTYAWEVSTDGGTTFTPVPGATNASLTVPAVTAALDGTIYHVIISNGCTTALTSDNVTLTVSDQATIDADPVATSACAGGNATFDVTATGNSLSYQWQVSTDGGTTWTDIASATGATLNLTGVAATDNNNQYRVNVLSICSATPTASASATLTVNPSPTVVVTASPYTSLAPGVSTTLTATATPSSSTFSWTKDGSAIAATGSTITVTSTELGSYAASVTDANGCTGTSNVVVITDSVVTTAFMYPNPTRGVFSVIYNPAGQFVTSTRNITAYDSKGARVYYKKFVVGTQNEKMQVDLSRYPKGIYLIELTDEGGVRLETARVIVY